MERNNLDLLVPYVWPELIGYTIPNTPTDNVQQETNPGISNATENIENVAPWNAHSEASPSTAEHVPAQPRRVLQHLDLNDQNVLNRNQNAQGSNIQPGKRQVMRLPCTCLVGPTGHILEMVSRFLFPFQNNFKYDFIQKFQIRMLAFQLITPTTMEFYYTKVYQAFECLYTVHRCFQLMPSYQMYDLELTNVSIYEIKFPYVVPYADVYVHKILRAFRYQSGEVCRRPFNFQMRLSSASKLDVLIKVFIGPRLDDAGQPLTFTDSARYFIEVDSFHYRLHVGWNLVHRLAQRHFVQYSKRRSPVRLTHENFQVYFHVSHYVPPNGLRAPKNYKGDCYLYRPKGFPFDRAINCEWIYLQKNSQLKRIILKHNW